MNAIHAMNAIIDILKAANTRADIQANRPLRLHPLRGKREGQFAIDLIKKSWRLILTFRKEEVEIVRIEEVSNHYDD
jgi:toxin HigB-1